MNNIHLKFNIFQHITVVYTHYFLSFFKFILINLFCICVRVRARVNSILNTRLLLGIGYSQFGRYGYAKISPMAL